MVDQLLSINNCENITVNDVYNLIGEPSEDAIFEILENISNCDIKAIIKQIDLYAKENSAPEKILLKCLKSLNLSSRIDSSQALYWIFYIFPGNIVGKFALIENNKKYWTLLEKEGIM